MMPLLFIQIIFIVSWSSGFIGAKIGVGESEPINLLFWRFLLVTLCLLPFIWKKLKRITTRYFLYHSVIGFLSQFVYLVCIYTAIRNGLPAGMAAIIAALQPLLTVALTSYISKEKGSLAEWIGLFIGFLGVGTVISGAYALSGGELSLVFYILPLFSALSLTIATLYQRKVALSASDKVEGGSLLPLFVQSCSSLFLLAAIGESMGLLHVSSAVNFWVSVTWLTIFSTFIAYLSLWALLNYMTATKTAALVYLEPPVTLIWAALMFGEDIQWTTILGLLIIVVGIFVSRWHLKTRDAYPVVD